MLAIILIGFAPAGQGWAYWYFQYRSLLKWRVTFRSQMNNENAKY